MADPTPVTPTPTTPTFDIAKIIAQLQTLAPTFAVLKTDLGQAVTNIAEPVPLIEHKDVIGIARVAIGDVNEIKQHIADLSVALGKFAAVVAAIRGQ